MNKNTSLFSIFGIKVQLHISWWFVFILLSWSLATSFFPEMLPDQTTTTYWILGIVSSLLLFVSVLLHELSHSLVARSQNIKVESITLFFFGGVAGISSEDIKPFSEFWMAMAGPLFSIVLGILFYIIHRADGGLYLTAISYYLYQLNFTLAIFNLIPGFPLDGGRAFRAILHAYYKDLVKATRIASAVGKALGIALFILGLVQVFGGMAAGLWFVLLGGFLYVLAKNSFEQVVVKNVLSRISVKEFTPVTLPKVDPNLLFSEFVHKYHSLAKDVFLVEDNSFSGILDTRLIVKMAPQQQSIIKLKSISVPFHNLKHITKNDNAYTALTLLLAQKIPFIPLQESGNVQHFIDQNSILHRLNWELKYGLSGKNDVVKKSNVGKVEKVKKTGKL
ncbi:site-2 protease family protein [Candidatus Woesearchaeota archaeon]|nr:site-2 protease family protein [Candidatus Woesearchaeota archaeon]